MDQQPGDLERAMTVLEAHGALADTVARARRYGAEAVDALAPFPECAEKRAFIALVDFCIDRAY